MLAFFGWAISGDDLIGIFVAIFIAVYLAFALLAPEKL